jgi:membrane protease YdiL (CAAX protease family)
VVTAKTRCVRLGLMLLGMVAFVVALQVVQFPMRLAHVPNVPGVVVISAIALAFYAGWVRLVERRRPDELAPRAALPQGTLGLGIGVLLFGVTMALLAGAGAYAIRGFGGWSGVAAGFIVMLGAAVVEEVLFRGFLFRTIRDIGGTWIAVAVSAAVFGALHAFNPGASAISTLAIALEAGVLLALSYAATNRLWLPIGLHAGWNFAEGSIFGTAVSGHATSGALLRGELHGPPALTGGSFGPEASFVAVLVCLAASVAFAIVVIRRDREPGSGLTYRSLRSTGT